MSCFTRVLFECWVFPECNIRAKIWIWLVQLVGKKIKRVKILAQVTLFFESTSNHPFSVYSQLIAG